MSKLVDACASVVDSIYKIANPAAYVQRLGQRQMANRLSYKNGRPRRNGPQGNAGKGSGDNHMAQGELNRIRELCRRLDRDNLFVSSILDRSTESVIGSGIKVSFSSGNKRWNKQAADLWSTYWNGSPEKRGIIDGPEFESLAFRTQAVDGDFLLVKTDDGTVQMIEGDRIQTPTGKLSTANIVNGVEYDQYGRITRFYVCKSQDAKQASGLDTFDTYHARDCIFPANRHRISMTRGLPKLTQSLDLLDDIDAFMEASIIQQKMAACHVMAVEQKGGPDAFSDDDLKLDEDGDRYAEDKFRAGQVMYMDVGETVKILGPQQSGQQFGPFMVQLLRFAGLAFGLPLEIVSLDFSRTNYSSARAALLIAHKCFVRQRRRFVKQFLEPIIRWKVEGWINEGLLDPREYRVVASPPRMISVDPLKEVKADIERINSGMMTLQQFGEAHDLEWTDMLDQRKEEIKYCAKIAKDIAAASGENWGARDIMGTSKDFTPEQYQDPNAEPPAVDPNA